MSDYFETDGVSAQTVHNGAVERNYYGMNWNQDLFYKAVEGNLIGAIEYD